MEAGWAPNGYYGKITERGRLVWFCRHHHTTPGDAQGCADRRLAQGDPPPPEFGRSRKVSELWRRR